jgi:hypothetical protein
MYIIKMFAKTICLLIFLILRDVDKAWQIPIAEKYWGRLTTGFYGEYLDLRGMK